jgi:hypothetical protein
LKYVPNIAAQIIHISAKTAQTSFFNHATRPCEIIFKRHNHKCGNGLRLSFDVLAHRLHPKQTTNLATASLAHRSGEEP